MSTWDTILFVVFPYVAFAFAIFGGVYRYFKDRYSYSSFSSQLLENRMLFWGVIIFHYSIIVILLAHLWQGWFPAWSNAWVSTPFALFMFEVTGYILGYLAAAGILILTVRRLVNPMLRRRTTVFDWLMFGALLVQILLGVHVAHVYRWGTMWYTATATPFFYSLLYLDPDPSTLVDLPWPVKAHAFLAYVIFLLFRSRCWCTSSRFRSRICGGRSRW